MPALSLSVPLQVDEPRIIGTRRIESIRAATLSGVIIRARMIQ